MLDATVRSEQARKLYQGSAPAITDCAHSLQHQAWCRVPRSQRGGEVIEPMVSEQWFLRTGGMAEAALAAVDDGRVTIMPPRFTKIYNNWLEGIQDWCISRQLWWGHRIPVWYCFKDAAEADAAGGHGDSFVVARNETDARQKVLVNPQLVSNLSPSLLHHLHPPSLKDLPNACLHHAKFFTLRTSLLHWYFGPCWLTGAADGC